MINTNNHNHKNSKSKAHQKAGGDRQGEWLEDSSSGRFSRLATTPEESTWICNDCGEPDADPYGNGCLICDAEVEIY